MSNNQAKSGKVFSGDRRREYRRRVERRQPQAGVTVRHDDKENCPPKRVRLGQRERDDVLDAEYVDDDCSDD